jgi:hypothetical protein
MMAQAANSSFSFQITRFRSDFPLVFPFKFTTNSERLSRLNPLANGVAGPVGTAVGGLLGGLISGAAQNAAARANVNQKP